MLTCNFSEIYCHGPLLHTIQTAELYSDSKTFVDKKLRFPPQQVLSSFEKLMNESQNQPTKVELQQFVDSNFEAEGLEFEPWHPSDWISDPPFLSLINNLEFRDWAQKLHEGWRFLGREIKGDLRLITYNFFSPSMSTVDYIIILPVDVRDNPELYSLVYVPNPFIIPGGRFRESYYWDSYWVVQGLLLCQMNQTVSF